MSLIASVAEIPCFLCPSLDRGCDSFRGITPANCGKLTHWLDAETNKGWYACPECGRELPSEKGLKIHMARMHK